MADDLLTYYERELNFLRQMGAEFAAKYPKIASRLVLEADTSEDPHVERLIQAFAFLAARVHHKIEDEYPEITESLLNVLYPHYLAPIPSMSIVQFVLDADQGKIGSGYAIQKGATLYSQPVAGSPCRFRTCYPTTLWPLEVEAAGLEAVDSSRQGILPRSALGLIRLELRCLAGMSLAELELDRLRFFIHGEARLTYTLYELLFNNVIEIRIRPRSGTQSRTAVRLPATTILPVGFAADEGLLPYGPRSFLGYRLLQEYFSFPEKFLFFDLTGLGKAVKNESADGFEIQILLNRMPRLEQPVTKETFRLGCAPIVNLFNQIAEPVRLSHAQTEYQVIPDVRRQNATEVYAVDSSASRQEPMKPSNTSLFIPSNMRRNGNASRPSGMRHEDHRQKKAIMAPKSIFPWSIWNFARPYRQSIPLLYMQPAATGISLVSSPLAVTAASSSWKARPRCRGSAA
jgi:type VI secretion system protein ImpG